MLNVFTPPSLRAAPGPGELVVREHRLDDVVHQIDLRGELGDAGARELQRRLDAALQTGVRWLIVDLHEALNATDAAVAALVDAAAALRGRRGELILAGAGRGVMDAINALEIGHRPAMAASVDQAIMILKMLRPKTDIRRPPDRAKQKISSLSLPRIEPA